MLKATLALALFVLLTPSAVAGEQGLCEGVVGRLCEPDPPEQPPPPPALPGLPDVPDLPGAPGLPDVPDLPSPNDPNLPNMPNLPDPSALICRFIPHQVPLLGNTPPFDDFDPGRSCEM